MSGIPGAPQRPRASPWPFAGMIGMACVLFLILASVLAAPWWVVAGLVLVWALALVLAISWWTPNPTRLPWIPVAVALLWLTAVVGGAAWFGWEA